MFEIALFATVLILGWITIGEAWHEHDIPWHTGKYFLLFLFGLLWFLLR